MERYPRIVGTSDLPLHYARSLGDFEKLLLGLTDPHSLVAPGIEQKLKRKLREILLEKI